MRDNEPHLNNVHLRYVVTRVNRTIEYPHRNGILLLLFHWHSYFIVFNNKNI